MHRIIIINGSAQAGKDTFVKLFTKHSLCTVLEWSTIQTVKDAATCFFGWDGIKNEKGRQLLSEIKDAWTKYNDGPFFEIVTKVSEYRARYKDLVFFIHVREPDEIAKLKQYFADELTTIRINRNGLAVPGNHADANVDKFKYDITVDNSSSLESLEYAAQQLAGAFTDPAICRGRG